MDLQFICRYCDHKWERNVYGTQGLENERCPKCNDLDIQIKDLSKTKIDTYAGAPAFKEKEEETGELPGLRWPSSWNMGND